MIETEQQDKNLSMMCSCCAGRNCYNVVKESVPNIKKYTPVRSRITGPSLQAAEETTSVNASSPLRLCFRTDRLPLGGRRFTAAAAILRGLCRTSCESLVILVVQTLPVSGQVVRSQRLRSATACGMHATGEDVSYNTAWWCQHVHREHGINCASVASRLVLPLLVSPPPLILDALSFLG